jgi:hypothetical protein
MADAITSPAEKRLPGPEHFERAIIAGLRTSGLSAASPGRPLARSRRLVTPAGA